MRKLILATIAAASLIVGVTAPASAAICKWEKINGNYYWMCR